ncbi:prolyl oligopeptidase family serine peptidase [Paracidobacterium acidisoli]|uniref:Peptidase S9 prolyl oligopeptidase catalytic domain-containing protein n=1 Tax=Paracidobacterium acidisoli TaxID=2303751 RepID=A0A372IKL5_9BACT|nr:prolyl oligopeptidase family serine peptidase [Paracidobacterium acidisoli]MBT9333025.1 prolyl oligopeptidase family serine peptidase [Paracidobacterium acidisoli]
MIVDVLSGSITRVLVSPDTDSFSISGHGTTIAYSVLNREPERKKPGGAEAEGYRIAFDEDTEVLHPTHSFYVLKQGQDDTWTQPQLLTIRNPITNARETQLVVNSHFTEISLSPDGNQLLFQYMTPALPKSWYDDPIVKLYAVQNTFFEILVRYDLTRKETSLAFDSISTSSVPVWSDDSKTFFVNAYSPVASAWQADDVHDNLARPNNANLFAVNFESDTTVELVRHISFYHEAPSLGSNGRNLVVHVAGNMIARVDFDRNGWRETGRESIPSGELNRISAVASNGHTTFVVAEAVTRPEDIFGYRSGEQRLHVLTDLNPEIRSLEFAKIKQVDWSVDGKYTASGLLFLPPDYTPGKRYPLVIQTKGEQGWFACDSGFSHSPSFAPEPLATAGIAYLAPFSKPSAGGPTTPHQLDGQYPGGVAEAVDQMKMWDSAVDDLARQGLIDPSKVGIIGFSRTGFHVEFNLAHAKTHYAAATVADNVSYSLAEYLYLPDDSHAADAMFGGPPFGASLVNWERYSVSYNLDKIRTPLLMEEMGYGVHDDNSEKIPLDLVLSYEIYRGLRIRKKPVEMYYYPDEEHQPDHPKARLASITRNLDWYRFWLQGYEHPNPEDPDQYKRWEHLRELRDADQKATGPINNDSQTSEAPR